MDLRDFYTGVNEYLNSSNYNEWEKKRIMYQLYPYYKNGINIDDVDDVILWNHPTYKEVRKARKELEDLMENPMIIEEGIFECGKCKSKRVYTRSVQTRSSDEGATSFYQCINCGNKWKN
jgi:DNA-directed RNA polymerase subunit M/transcription elongation factor TFIIS